MKYHIPKSRGCQVPNIVDIYMEHIGYKEDGYYVEVGAFNGLDWTNSECFAIAGWNGILIEPQHIIVKECAKNYKEYEKVIVKECAIGDYNGQITLFGDGSLATTDSKMVDKYKELSWSAPFFIEEKEMSVDVYTLDYILEKYTWPEKCIDVLIIDTEGTEASVLKGFDIDKWSPTMMVIECVSDDEILSHEKEINNILLPKGYKVILRGLNNIYVKK